MNITTDNLKLSVDQKGIARLVFDLANEKINKLDYPTSIELSKILDEVANDKSIRALVITSAKKGIFIAGADINEIKKIKDESDALARVKFGQDIINKLAALKIPTIAVINGACLGGGLELALACQYRIAVVSPKTVLGLPEVNLGIIPGFGGTQRLPRLIGLQESLKMILAGKSVDARKALKIGLVDDLANEEFLAEKLLKFIDQAIKTDNRYLQTRAAAKHKRFIFEDLLLMRYLIPYLAKRDLLAKTKGHYPAPLAALEVIKETYPFGRNDKENLAGFEVELNRFSKLAASPTAKNLIDIFFISEELKKEGSDVKTKEIKDVALIGAGVMGGGIAWLFSNYDINIRVKDITQNAIALGYQQVFKIYNQLRKIGKFKAEQISNKVNKISSGLDYTDFENADLAIEAVVENLEVKKKILAEAESYLRDDAIIASNTSSLSITSMAAALKHPQRFVGMHFFNPVNRMPLVEVIYGQESSDESIYSTVALAKKLGKTPIIVKDVAGFLVNRILLPYLNEAAFILQEGESIEKIDQAVEDFGMPMGPFVLADVVGIDVGYKVAHSLFEAYGERMKVAEILEVLHQSHPSLLGKKSKRGFYLYSGFSLSKKPVNPEIQKILQNLKKAKVASSLSANEIAERTILIMINEASRCLEEGVVKNARYLDMAMIMGAGFPPFRGGVMKYADQLGIKNVVAKLQQLEQMNSRFKPSDLLVKMAANDEKFYS